MRISDWSSDVCSSDLGRIGRGSGTWTPGCTASSSAPPTRRLYTRVARTPWEIPSQLGRAPRDRGRAAFRRRSMSKDLFGYTLPPLLRGVGVLSAYLQSIQQAVDKVRFLNSEERRVGKECVSNWSSGRLAYP